MRVISVATHSERMFDLFKQSGQKFGYTIDIVGFGEVWKGFAWRFDLILKRLLELEDSEELVLISDAFDVVFIDYPATFIKRFKKLNSKIVFTCDPISEQWYCKCLANYYRKRLFFHGNNKLVLNGGTYTGKVCDLIRMIRNLPHYKDNDDDQKILTALFHKNHFENATVDFNSSLVYHQNWGFLGKLPKKLPVLMSFPGGGESPELLKQLNIEYIPPSTFDREFISVCWRRIVHILPNFKYEIILVFIIIYLFFHFC
jgi:hypothetical protein